MRLEGSMLILKPCRSPSFYLTCLTYPLPNTHVFDCDHPPEIIKKILIDGKLY